MICPHTFTPHLCPTAWNIYCCYCAVQRSNDWNTFHQGVGIVLEKMFVRVRWFSLIAVLGWWVRSAAWYCYLLLFRFRRWPSPTPAGRTILDASDSLASHAEITTTVALGSRCALATESHSLPRPSPTRKPAGLAHCCWHRGLAIACAICVRRMGNLVWRRNDCMRHTGSARGWGHVAGTVHCLELIH